MKSALSRLEYMKPYRRNGNITKSDAFADKFLKFGVGIACVPLAFLCLLALWHNLILKLPPVMVAVTLWCAIAFEVIAVFSLLCPMIIIIGTSMLSGRERRELRDAEIDHEANQVAIITAYSSEELKSAKRYLENKIKRLERRLGYFIDSDSKKFATLSLLIMNLTIINALINGSWEKLFLTAGFQVSTQLISVIAAFMFFVSLSAIFARLIINRELYKIELIETALATQNE